MQAEIEHLREINDLKAPENLPTVTAQIIALENRKVEIGMPVEMVTRKLRNATDERGLLVYGYKFRTQVERQTA